MPKRKHDEIINSSDEEDVHEDDNHDGQEEDEDCEDAVPPTVPMTYHHKSRPQKKARTEATQHNKKKSAGTKRWTDDDWEKLYKALGKEGFEKCHKLPREEMDKLIKNFFPEYEGNMQRLREKMARTAFTDWYAKKNPGSFLGGA